MLHENPTKEMEKIEKKNKRDDINIVKYQPLIYIINPFLLVILLMPVHLHPHFHSRFE